MQKTQQLKDAIRPIVESILREGKTTIPADGKRPEIFIGTYSNGGIFITSNDGDIYLTRNQADLMKAFFRTI